MKQTAILAAQAAGKILMGQFGHTMEMNVVVDRRYDFTTKVDLEAERAILKILKRKTPTYRIITEEAGDDKRKSPFTWVVDPLDGTTNYSIGNPFFNVSIALVKDQEPILGVVYAPVIDWLFLAEKDKGSTLNGKAITVSDKTRLDKCLCAFCHGYNEKDIKRIIQIFPKLKLAAKDFNQMRSGAYELALVAAGKLGAFLAPGANSWDVAAGTLLVREAGGRVTDFSGKDWNLNSKDILATNGKVHNQILKIIKGV